MHTQHLHPVTMTVEAYPLIMIKLPQEIKYSRSWAQYYTDIKVPTIIITSQLDEAKDIKVSDKTAVWMAKTANVTNTNVMRPT